MFSLTLTGKILAVQPPVKVNDTLMHAWVNLEETHFVDGSPVKRVWHLHVSPDEYKRREKLLVVDRYIGASAYDLNAYIDERQGASLVLVALVGKLWIL